MHRTVCSVATLTLLIGLTATTTVTDTFAQSFGQITRTPIANKLSLLSVGEAVNGAFVGNMVLLEDSGEALLIDTGVPQIANDLLVGLRDSGFTLSWVVNTHHHLDHIGGNDAVMTLGAGVLDPQESRTVTVGESKVVVQKLPAGHSESDYLVHFPQQDVLVVGDVFVPDQYPFVDLSRGGTVGNLLEAIDVALALAGPDTKIVPGHGEITGRAKLQELRTIIAESLESVGNLKKQKLTEEEVMRMQPTRKYDAVWGRGFVGPVAWVRQVYRSL